MNVLVAEDDEVDAFLIGRAIRKASDQVRLSVTTDGEQTVQYLKGEGIYSDRSLYPLPVLCLLDIQLPKMDGIEVLKWIRAQPGLRHLCVAVVTGSIWTKHHDLAFQHQADYVLQKSTVASLSLALTDVLSAVQAPH